MQKPTSKTDWTRVKREADQDAHIPFNREDELYDPNNEAEVEAFFETANVRRGRGPQKTPTKELISIRLSPEVVEYFRSTGDGWQGRINGVLSRYVRRKRA